MNESMPDYYALHSLFHEVDGVGFINVEALLDVLAPLRTPTEETCAFAEGMNVTRENIFKTLDYTIDGWRSDYLRLKAVRERARLQIKNEHESQNEEQTNDC